MVTLCRENITQVVGSVDWGFTNPSVIQIWAIDRDDRAYMIWEFYQSGVLITELVQVMKRVQEQFQVDYFVCDPSEPAYIRQCQEAGINAREALNDVAPGIQKVQDRLPVAGDGKTRLYFLRGARLHDSDPALQEKHKPLCTAEEFDGYVWAKIQSSDRLKEEPMKKDDHGMDAMRYFVYYLDGKGSSPGVFF